MAERILFMRLSSLGDVLLTSPAVRAARRAFPDARIVFMTYAQYAPLYAHNPRVDAVIPLQKGAKGTLDALKQNSGGAVRPVGRPAWEAQDDSAGAGGRHTAPPHARSRA